MESIRSRYQSRLSDNNDTRAYGNDNITATFRSLGLYNNDSSTLQAAAPAGGDAAGGSFIATKLRDPAAAATPLTYWYNISQPDGAKPLHAYRANAWNDAQYDTSDEGVWRTASPDAYKTEPLNLKAA
jgi:hypothetical protein